MSTAPGRPLIAVGAMSLPGRWFGWIRAKAHRHSEPWSVARVACIKGGGWGHLPLIVAMQSHDRGTRPQHPAG